MIIRLTTILAFTAVLSACASGPATGPDPAQAVREAALTWKRCYEAADLECLMGLYTEDVTVALHGQPALHGRDAVRAYFQPRIGRLEARFELDFESIEVHGPVAFLVSKYWLSASRDGKAVFRDAGRSLLIYRLEGGRWLIHVDIDQATPDVTWPAEAPAR